MFFSGGGASEDDMSASGGVMGDENYETCMSSLSLWPGAAMTPSSLSSLTAKGVSVVVVNTDTEIILKNNLLLDRR